MNNIQICLKLYSLSRVVLYKNDIYKYGKIFTMIISNHIWLWSRRRHWYRSTTVLYRQYKSPCSASHSLRWSGFFLDFWNLIFSERSLFPDYDEIFKKNHIWSHNSCAEFHRGYSPFRPRPFQPGHFNPGQINPRTFQPHWRETSDWDVSSPDDSTPDDSTPK